MSHAVRFMVLSDLGSVAWIEQSACKRPWSAQRLQAMFRERNVIGRVATNLHGDIVGYTLYELLPRSVQIRSFVVAPQYQRLGVGTALIQHLKKHLLRGQRLLINVQVTDDNTGAHHFLKAQGFRAMAVVPGDERDVYLFEYRALAPQRPVPIYDCGDQVA